MVRRRVTVDAVSALAVVVLGLSTVIIWQAVQRQADAWQWVVHTREVLQRLEQVNASMRRAESAERGYLLDSDPASLSELDATTAQLQSTIAAIETLTHDNPTQQAHIAGLRRVATQRVAELRGAATNRGRQTDAERPQGRSGTDEVGELVAAMQAEERGLLAQRERQVDAARRDLLVWVGASGVITVLLIGALRWVSRRAALTIQFGLAKINAIYRAAPVGLGYVDRDLRLIELNDALARMNGSPRDNQIGKRPEDLFPTALAERVSAFYRSVLTTGTGCVGVDIGGAIHDGDGPRDWLASYQPVVEDAHVAGLVVALLDVTALKAAQRALAEANRTLEKRVAERTEQLTEANAELQAFAHTVAHDLRAPLRNIEGFATALLEEDSLDAAAERPLYLGRIQSGVRRMDQLITDLLAYSRVGRASVQLETVNVGAAIHSALRDLDAMVRETGAVVRLGEPLPDVCGNRQLLVQVFSNLLSNALKFTASGVRPQIAVRADTRPGRIDVTVEDNGIGIAPEHRERVFGVFERLHGQEAYPGTGIGLAIVRRAVQRMRGDVAVEPAPDGTRFIVSLPAADTEPCRV